MVLSRDRLRADLPWSNISMGSGRGSMSSTEWDASANDYRIESEGIAFYQATNRELIDAGEIRPGMIIVDLACGAGLTTRTILASVGDACTIYAVDSAEEMLRQSRGVIISNSVHFIHASADDFSQYVTRPVDRVFCNAAFWHLPDPNAAIKEITTVLRPNGRFLFNIPDQVFDFGDGKQSEMANVVAECLQQPYTPAYQFSYASIQSLADGNGYGIVDFKSVEIALRPEDLVRFYSIPHFGARRFPGRSSEERREILTTAFSHLSPDRFPRYRWAQFTLKPVQRTATTALSMKLN